MESLKLFLNNEIEMVSEAMTESHWNAISIAKEYGDLEKVLSTYPKNQPGHDAYGRKLEIGDWVLCIPSTSRTNSSQQLGIVAKVTAKQVSILIPANSKNIRVEVLRMVKYDDTLTKKLSDEFMAVVMPGDKVFKITNIDDFMKSLN